MHRLAQQPDQQAQADDHVQGVHAGHREVEREEELGAPADLAGEMEVRSGDEVMLPLRRVLEVLDHQEGDSQEAGGVEPVDERLDLPQLRGTHSQRHGEGAPDEDDGVESTELDRKLVAAGREGVRVLPAVEQVTHEQAAEEHDLLHQKEPHPEGGGLLLLLEVVEVVRQIRGMAVGHEGGSLFVALYQCERAGGTPRPAASSAASK